MDTSIITEVGIGGAVAIIIIREVLNFVKEKKNNNSNSISRREFDKHKESVQYKDNCEQIVKRIDAAFEAQEKMFKMMEKRIEQHFREVKKLILNGGK
jgi:hypothetical protein